MCVCSHIHNILSTNNPHSKCELRANLESEDILSDPHNFKRLLKVKGLRVKVRMIILYLCFPDHLLMLLNCCVSQEIHGKFMERSSSVFHDGFKSI